MNRYKTLMAKVELTDATKNRVMENVITSLGNDYVENDNIHVDSNIYKDTDTTLTSDTRKNCASSSTPPKNTHKFKMYRYLATAACLILIITSGIFYRHHQPNTTTPDTQNPDEFVLSGNSIQELNSLEDLSNAVGFDIKTPQYLPFTPSGTNYLSYFGDMAEINYSNTASTASFRMAVGDDDISGDYNEYDNVKIAKITGITVTLKGNTDGYSLAIWQSDGYTYALSLSEEVSENEWVKILESIQ